MRKGEMSLSQPKSLINFLTMVAIVTLLSNCQAAGVCPKSSISPCSCVPEGNNITIFCSGENLDDSKAISVLNAFLAPGLSPVTKIHMSSNKLTKVPMEVSKFPALLSIDFSSNQIGEIPNNAKEPLFKNRLTTGRIAISLTNNKIKTIPSGVFNFPSSKNVFVDLSGNQIASVPSDAFKFPSASEVEIRLSSNQLSSIPSAAFTNFPLAIDSLIIYLDLNKITSVQRGAFSFIPDDSKSSYINLAGNQITTIPCGPFGNPLWSHSVNFDLSKNKITTIPSCAFIFPSAKSVTLYFSHNSITTISPGAFNFPSATTISLILEHNKISSIPPNTFAQGKYYVFNLRYNQLKRFESGVFKSPLVSLPKFSTLDISANPIDCTTDPCHLAWLLTGSNSTQMRSQITGHGANGQEAGVCAKYSYDPPFTALNTFDFNKKCTCTF